MHGARKFGGAFTEFEDADVHKIVALVTPVPLCVLSSVRMIPRFAKWVQGAGVMHTKSLGTILAVAALAACTVATAFAEKTYVAWADKDDLTSNQTQRGVAVAVDKGGNVAAAGFTDNNGKGIWQIYRYAGGTGTRIWKRTMDNLLGDIRPVAITTDSNRNVITTGRAQTTNGYDFYTEKRAAADGALIWGVYYDGPAHGQDEAVAVAVDPQNNVIVTGRSVQTGNYDFATIKYNGINGAVMWERRYNSQGNFEDAPRGLAVDSGGNVAVAGYSRTGSNQCWYVARYAGANGGVVWEKTFDGPDNKDDQAFGVAMNDAGDVYATGTVINANGTYAFHTRKYSAGNGTVLWQKTYNAPTDSYTNPAGIRVDAAGDAFICGTSELDNFKTTFYTAKYAGADGALLWEKRSPAEPGDDDLVSAFTLDAGGNVIVTGSSEDAGQVPDFYTVKYAGTDGATLWEERLNGDQDAGSDTANAVATDAGGDVVVTGTARKAAPSANFEMLTVKYSRHLLTVGDAITGQGLNAATVVAPLAQPAVAQSFGSIAFASKVRVQDGKKFFNGVMTQGKAGGNVAIALQGQLPPGVMQTTAKYASFLDPVVSQDGTVAFIAKLSGVPSAEATGVWCDINGNGLEPVIQTGKQAPGLPAGVLVKGITAINLAGSGFTNTLTSLVTLKGTGVTAANATAVIAITPAPSEAKLFRTGDMVTVNGTQSSIKKLSIFTPPKTSAGHGRYTGANRVVVTATLADKRTALLASDISGNVTPLLASDGDASAVQSGTKWKAFGFPSVGADGQNFSTIATIKSGTAKVSATSDTAIVISTDGTAFTPYVIEGGTLPTMAGVTFTAFGDPVSPGAARIAFIGTFKGTGVSSANNRAIFFGSFANYFPAARIGNAAPDTDGTAGTETFASFSTLAMPGRVAFIAKLKGKGVTGKNDTGLWYIDGPGNVRRAFRTGDLIGDQTVAKFALLTALPGSFSATRSINEAGTVIALVTFTDKTSSLIRITLQ